MSRIYCKLTISKIMEKNGIVFISFFSFFMFIFHLIFNYFIASIDLTNIKLKNKKFEII